MATEREQVTNRFHIDVFLLNICSGTICKCSRDQVQIQRKKQIVSLLKRVTMTYKVKTIFVGCLL